MKGDKRERKSKEGKKQKGRERCRDREGRKERGRSKERNIGGRRGIGKQRRSIVFAIRNEQGLQCN